MNLSTKFAGITLSHPIFNSAGPRDVTLEELKALGSSESAAIVSKSCTLEHREGNPKPRYYDFEGGSINSMGLPNLGYLAYKEMYPQLTSFNKPLISSVSGMCLADNMKIIETFCGVPEIDAIELNLSCPNLVGKPQVGYDFEQTRDVLDAIGKICKKPLGVKLPPYFDMVHFQEMAEILNKSKIQYVSCINSLGNGLVIDPETEQAVIKPKGGFGGVGGKVVKPFALANVRKFKELLKPEIAIIGCGGVMNGVDVFEHILAGADAVQIGTALQQEGPDVFTRLLAEFKQVLQKKGYNSLDEFRNKLKVM